MCGWLIPGMNWSRGRNRTLASIIIQWLTLHISVLLAMSTNKPSSTVQWHHPHTNPKPPSTAIFDQHPHPFHPLKPQIRTAETPTPILNTQITNNINRLETPSPQPSTSTTNNLNPPPPSPPSSPFNPPPTTSPNPPPNPPKKHPTSPSPAPSPPAPSASPHPPS